VFLLTLELSLRAEATWRWGAPFWGPYSFETLMLSEVDRNPWTSVAELNVLGTGGRVIPQTNWRLRYVDSEEKVGENGVAVNAFDGSAGTFWHTQWKGGSIPPPHEIQIDLSGNYNIDGFRYLPRQDSWNGTIRNYEFYVSVDGVTWGSSVASGAFANTMAEKEVLFTTKSGRYVRLRALNDAMEGGNRPGSRFEKWIINGQGFQGPELLPHKPKGITRIGVAGASEIFGLYESPGCDVTSLVRKLLERSAPGRFEVVNLSTPGMSIPRIVELYEKWIRKFDFDAILYYPSPAMYLDTEAPSFRRSVPGNPESVSASDSHGWNLRLPGKTWDMLRERLPNRLQLDLKWYQIEKKRRQFPKEWVWEHHAPQGRVTIFREHLEEFIKISKQDGTRVVLATHANRFRDISTEKHGKHIVAWNRYYPRASGESILDMEQKANQVIRELGVKYNIIVVDVEKSVGKDPHQYADFTHFTDSGAALAAEAMKDSILSHYR
jgi:lysophospholipase L1-like esterase